MLIAAGLGIGSAHFAAAGSENLTDAAQPQFVTKIAEFGALSGTDYLSGCNFRLAGMVTLVDTNRELVVVQDATGAVALNFHFDHNSLQVGQLVVLDGEGAAPYVAGFPAYPHRPAERDVLDSFESLIDTNEYRLTRMRACVSPPKAGEYTFWLASDNSSELWLSVNSSPSRARRIASIPRFGWANPREWSHYPSQRSEPVTLKAGEVYYIEAIAEQTTGGEHLEVAWEGPGLSQSVIESPYLTPFRAAAHTTHGVLRECWTNFSAGDLDGLTGPRPFESALCVERVRLKVSGRGQMPKPQRISLSESFSADRNYRWVQAEGLVGFAGVDDRLLSLQLSDGRAAVQVRALCCGPEDRKRLRNVFVQVEGVLEGVSRQDDPPGTLAPGIIWASVENSITIEAAGTNAALVVTDRSTQPITATNTGKGGFYGMSGVVTFNDRVFDQDYIFVQGEAAALRIELGDHALNRRLEVGECVDLGGALEPGRYVQSITPLYIKDFGMRPMPSPITQPLASADTGNREGRWSELGGVVHSVNPNGTVSLVGGDGRAYVWVGQTPSNCLASWVDARLRARGVLLLKLLDTPVLLAPSRHFIDVEEDAPQDSSGTSRRSIAELFPDATEPSTSHRARVMAEVTLRGPRSFFIQDASGGIRVLPLNQPSVEVGEAVEVLAFPAMSGSGRTLTEALVRPGRSMDHIKPRILDLNQALSSDQIGTLVQISAALVGRKTNGLTQLLELEEQRRAFVATLAPDQGNLPNIPLGSRVRITGVCSDESTAMPAAGGKPPKTPLPASLNILLRSPGDVAVLAGPPWWTLRRTVTLVGTLLTMIMAALLWVHLLRGRLERQQSAQLAFSRKMLEGLEDERQRIAANLHDGLGQTLMVIKNTALLAMQRTPDGAGLTQPLEEISGASSQAIEEVRQITLGLRPYQLDRLGLTQAVRASIDRATVDSPISFATRVEDVDGLFGPDAEIHVYRIVQEAVTNVVKHSRATEAAVVLKKRDEAVSLCIRDNGCGFDSQNLDESHHLGYGLSGIAERARILGATSSVESRLGAGTNLTVEIPIPIHRNGARSNSSDRG